MIEIPDSAVGLSAFRLLKNGSARQYTAARFNRERDGVARFLRTCAAFGYIPRSDGEVEGYAVLDVLDDRGDIVCDFVITTNRAWAWIKGQLDLKVESTDGDEVGRR